MQAVSYSVLPLGLQILKLTIYVIALLSVIRAWGGDISTVLAGIGVGGIAIALAAQKTIENLFGGVSVIGDRPVLVGDDCKFGTQTGTVIHIGLRSTQLRTPDRTIISVPNAQFSSMPALREPVESRWRHLLPHRPEPVRRDDTASSRTAEVLKSAKEILGKQPKVEPGALPVRLIGLGTYSLDVEIGVYILTTNGDEYLSIQQDLLMQLLQAVEHAGTALAVPWQQDLLRLRNENPPVKSRVLYRPLRLRSVCNSAAISAGFSVRSSCSVIFRGLNRLPWSHVRIMLPPTSGCSAATDTSGTA